MIKVAKKRIAQGESINDILDGWSKLTESEKEEIRKAVSNV